MCHAHAGTARGNLARAAAASSKTNRGAFCLRCLTSGTTRLPSLESSGLKPSRGAHRLRGGALAASSVPRPSRLTRPSSTGPYVPVRVSCLRLVSSATEDSPGGFHPVSPVCALVCRRGLSRLWLEQLIRVLRYLRPLQGKVLPQSSDLSHRHCPGYSTQPRSISETRWACENLINRD